MHFFAEKIFFPFLFKEVLNFCVVQGLEFYRKGISNGVQLTCQFLMIFYGPKEDPGVKELGQESPGASTRVGARPPPQACGPASWTLRAPP